MHAVAAIIIALAAVQVIVEPQPPAAADARIIDGYPVILALLEECPVSVEAYVNGVSIGRVPFKAAEASGSCNVTVDFTGASLLQVYPGDNLTLVYHTPAGNITVEVLLETGSHRTVAGGGEETVNEPEIIVGSGGEDNTPTSTKPRTVWLAASIVLAATALLVGAKEYAGE